MNTRSVIAMLVAMMATTAVQLVRAEDAAKKEETAASCPKCETTWVTRPETVGKLTVYRSEKKMSCEECGSAVANFFKTGKLEHTCKTCGELSACKVQQVEAKPTSGTPAGGAKEGAVMCPKCQAVWVKKSKDLDKRTVYWMEKKEPCASCQTTAMEMLDHGKTEGKCAKCGDELKSCH